MYIFCQTASFDLLKAFDDTPICDGLYQEENIKSDLSLVIQVQGWTGNEMCAVLQEKIVNKIIEIFYWSKFKQMPCSNQIDYFTSRL